MHKMRELARHIVRNLDSIHKPSHREMLIHLAHTVLEQSAAIKAACGHIYARRNESSTWTTRIGTTEWLDRWGPGGSAWGGDQGGPEPPGKAPAR
jgi:hypothetical protein